MHIKKKSYEIINFITKLRFKNIFQVSHFMNIYNYCLAIIEKETFDSSLNRSNDIFKICLHKCTQVSNNNIRIVHLPRKIRNEKKCNGAKFSDNIFKSWIVFIVFSKYYCVIVIDITTRIYTHCFCYYFKEFTFGINYLVIR